MKKILVLLALATCGAALAVDRNAATCAFADVQSAYNAAVDGDRVVIPACSSTSWGASTLTVAKGVQIVGAGVTGTIIPNAKFTVTVPAGKVWRISGFATSGTVGVNVTGFSKSGRIDHVAFTGANITGFVDNRVLYITPNSGDYSAGVIDHISFGTASASVTLNSIQIHSREGDGGNSSWTRPLGLGGPDAWYIEDSTFYQTPGSENISAPITDCDGGGRFVFRHNVVSDNYYEMHDAIVGGLRSCRKWEIYENQWVYGNPNWAQIAIRGGNGVAFNNTFAAAFNPVIMLSAYRTEQTGETPWGDCPVKHCSLSSRICRTDSTCSSQQPSEGVCNVRVSAKACVRSTSSVVSCTTDAQCGGVSGSCQEIDGNDRGTGLMGYPCRDQIGTDTDYTGQPVRPAIFWNNTSAGVQQSAVYEGTGLSTYVTGGRDFCNGTGNGSGQPTTCAGRPVPYTPYTYPHPLQNAFNAPRAPTGVN